MDEAPHPSTLSEILDRTVQIYRRRFLVFFGLAAAPYAAVLVPVCALLLIGYGMGSPGPGVATTVQFAVLVAIGVSVVAPVWIAATALSTGALNHAALHCYFGEAISIRGAWKEGWARGWRYTGLYMLELLLIWAAPVFVWMVVVAAGAALAEMARTRGIGPYAALLLGALAVILVSGLVVYGSWMLLRLALAFPACVMEQIGVSDALRRGIALSRGTRGRILLLYLLGWVLSYLLTLAVTLPLTVALAFMPGLQNPEHAQAVGVLVFVAVYGMAVAAQVLTKPVYAIAMALFYFDQRIRQEGFDIEWMMLRAGLVVPQTPAIDAEVYLRVPE